MQKMQATKPLRHQCLSRLQPVRASSQCVGTYKNRAPGLPVRVPHEQQARASEGSGALSPSIDQGLYGEHASSQSACHSSNRIFARLHAVQCTVSLLLPGDAPSTICSPSPSTLRCRGGSHSEAWATRRACLDDHKKHSSELMSTGCMSVWGSAECADLTAACRARPGGSQGDTGEPGDTGCQHHRSRGCGHPAHAWHCRGERAFCRGCSAG